MVQLYFMKKNYNPFTKLDLLLVILICTVAMVFRLYKINTPLADLHSWRQADTAAVARNYVRYDIDLLHPRYDDLSSNQTGHENPQGYRFVEFPIYNAVIAYAYNFYPNLPIEIYGRIVSALFSLLIIISLYYLCLKESNRFAAIVTSGVYATFPFFVFFSRTILPETTAISLAIFSIFLLYISNEKQRGILSIILLILSAISISMAVLVKPTVIFYGLAILVLFIYRYKWLLPKKISIYIFGFIALLPLVLWRLYIQKYPEGIPFNDWLITSVNTFEGLKNVLFRPAFFRWIFFERINNFILGGYLTFFFILGLIKKQGRFILLSIITSGFFYLFVFQGGNVQHEYYQTILLPAIAIAVGVGTAEIVSNRNNYWHPIFTYLMIIIIFSLSFFFSFYKVRDYYNYPAELPQIAKIVNTLTQPTDKIVTDRMGDTTLLYLMDRKGAPSIYKDPVELKKFGYTYLVTMSKGEISDLKKQKYQTVFENDVFTLFKL